MLSTDAEDWAADWPARYLFLEHQVRNDKAQQWFWNESTGTIHNAESPNYFLQNNKGELMVANSASTAKDVSAEFPRTDRKWFFDQVNHLITT